MIFHQSDPAGFVVRVSFDQFCPYFVPERANQNWIEFPDARGLPFSLAISLHVYWLHILTHPFCGVHTNVLFVMMTSSFHKIGEALVGMF